MFPTFIDNQHLAAFIASDDMAALQEDINRLALAGKIVAQWDAIGSYKGEIEDSMMIVLRKVDITIPIELGEKHKQESILYVSTSGGEELKGFLWYIGAANPVESVGTLKQPIDRREHESWTRLNGSTEAFTFV